MGTIAIGSAVVWGLVTALTGGNWQAGLVVAGVLFFSVMGGMRRRREELYRQERQMAAEDVMAALYAPTPRHRWFNR